MTVANISLLVVAVILECVEISMSMILCCECGNLCDCDNYPEGFYRGEDDEPGDEYRCASCNERDW